MNIAEASRRSGLSAKTIRYYEEIGLVSPERAGNGYRKYDELQIHRLCFLQRSRSLGFSIEQARALLSLYGDSNRHSFDVRSLADGRVAEIDRKIEELQSLRRALTLIADRCPGNLGPDCPILDEIAGKEPLSGGSAASRISGI